MKWKTVVFLLLPILAALSYRASMAVGGELGHADLDRFEARSYGVDLPEWYGDVPFLLPWTNGDGQAFVTLAADPFLRESATGLGAPNYRYGRIGMSWLAAVISAGRHELIPIALAAINILSIGGLGLITADELRSGNRWSWLLIANPAIYQGFAGDTAEPLGILLLVLALRSTRLSRSIAASVALGLVRPSYLTGALAAKRRPVIVTVAGLAAAASTRLLVAPLLGAPFSGDGGNLGPPLFGYWDALPFMRERDVFAAALVFLLASLAIYRGFFRIDRPTRKAAFAATGILVLSVSELVVMRSPNVIRAAGALIPLLALESSLTIGENESGNPGTTNDFDRRDDAQRASET